jgi:SAM-dependent methyltransferase
MWAESVNGQEDLAPADARAIMTTSGSHGGSSDEYVLGHSDKELARLNEQARIVDPITRRFLDEAGLSPGMRVLDVGSGAGHVAVLAAKLVGESGEVVGVDQSSVALGVAAVRANAASQGNISFRQGDLAEMTFAEPFDAVIGRYVLCFQREPAEMLKKLAQHVRPGGLIIFHETDHDGFSSFPPSPLFDSCCRWVRETCRLHGVDPCVGLKLHSVFVSAGLPAPSMRLEAVLGGGKNGFNCLHLIAGIVEIMSAEIVRLGVATAEDIGLETLVERMSTEAIARDILLVGRSEIGAWARVR